MELWKKTEGFQDYMISNLGRVKSLKFKKERILKSGKNGGYLNVNLCKNGKRYTKLIHRLVLETFNSVENMDILECNHKKGIKSDNRLEKLEWCTRSENQKHAFRIGLQPIMKGKKHHMFGKHQSEESNVKRSETMKGQNCGELSINSVLTENDIINVKIDLKEGKLKQKEIAKKFKVSQPTISYIKNGKRWSYIDDRI